MPRVYFHLHDIYNAAWTGVRENPMECSPLVCGYTPVYIPQDVAPHIPGSIVTADLSIKNSFLSLFTPTTGLNRRRPHSREVSRTIASPGRGSESSISHNGAGRPCIIGKKHGIYLMTTFSGVDIDQLPEMFKLFAVAIYPAGNPGEHIHTSPEWSQARQWVIAIAMDLDSISLTLQPRCRGGLPFFLAESSLKRLEKIAEQKRREWRYLPIETRKAMQSSVEDHWQELKQPRRADDILTFLCQGAAVVDSESSGQPPHSDSAGAIRPSDAPFWREREVATVRKFLTMTISTCLD
ncbi:hypothetical protein C8R43DRAFT_961918 [Mycena crocata]|nr:hypothetical protein C8R43DRAFT_961918 [Mycena crocata]